MHKAAVILSPQLLFSGILYNLAAIKRNGINMKQTYHHIGIIGFGARGQQLAQMVVSQLPAYGKITAFADSDENLVIPADLYHNCHGLKRYLTYQELLKDPEIDTVIITTYPETHVEISIAAMDAGKAVLCDKPVAGNLEDAVKLYDYVKKHPCKFAIGLNLPFYPSARKIKELIEKETIGNLLCIRGMCDVGASFGEGVIMRKFAGQPEGLILGKLTHDTDLIQYFADSYAEEVTGHSANFLWKRHGDLAGSHDTAVIAGRMNNGILFSQSLTSCGATYGRVMELWGSLGLIRADINSETITIALNGEAEQTLQLPPRPGSHRGGDKIMFAEFLDYVDSDEKEPLRPERILTSIMIPLAAMKQKTVQTGEWFRMHV